jgi:hypothetical protein
MTLARGSGWIALGTIAMQSTGQGGTQSSQPVHSAAITVCMRFALPTIASTGQACMHFVQPMQIASSMTASVGGASSPYAGSIGFDARPSSAASASTPPAPPGGQRSISASSPAIAFA